MMSVKEAVLYGVVQGLTEYLPVSSSAHLILLPRFLGTEDPGLAFDVFMHLGTLLATLVFFWRDWVAVARGMPIIGRYMPAWNGVAQGVDWKWIVLATLPAVIAGVLLHDRVESSFRGNSVLVVTLSVGGLLLWSVDRFCSPRLKLGQMGWLTVLGVGIAQACALIPGVSRSGATITGGRALGLDRDSAARFSFLISAPITAAALVHEAAKLRQVSEGAVGWPLLLLATVCSFGAGIIAIGGLLRLVRSTGYGGFAVYRVILALVIAYTL